MAEAKHGKDDRFDYDASASAADDPTAMWDADELRRLGLEEGAPEEGPTPPVTRPLAHGSAAATAPSIVVDARDTGALRAAPPRQPAQQELSWPATVGIAIGLGAVVYALVRYVL